MLTVERTTLWVGHDGSRDWRICLNSLSTKKTSRLLLVSPKGIGGVRNCRRLPRSLGFFDVIPLPVLWSDCKWSTVIPCSSVHCSSLALRGDPLTVTMAVKPNDTYFKVDDSTKSPFGNNNNHKLSHEISWFPFNNRVETARAASMVGVLLRNLTRLYTVRSLLLFTKIVLSCCPRSTRQWALDVFRFFCCRIRSFGVLYLDFGTTRNPPFFFTSRLLVDWPERTASATWRTANGLPSRYVCTRTRAVGGRLDPPQEGVWIFR